jgi:septal ring factor EnvC (AmiA/AmiB activator)
MKRDIDESPLSVLRAELSTKNMQLQEVETKMRLVVEEREEARKKFEVIKKDMVALKKQMDKEQREVLAR